MSEPIPLPPDTGQSTEFVVVGKVTKPWGLRGELKVELLTDFPERFKPGCELYIQNTRYLCQGVKKQGRFLIIKLQGVDYNRAEALKGASLEVPASSLEALPPGTYYHSQIMGLEVTSTSGEYLGTIQEIITTGSNDVYVVRRDKRELLIPAIADVIKSIDIANGKMEVELLEGLL